MVSHGLPSEESAATYEIRLQGTPTESLQERFPSATVFTTPTETVLYRQVEETSELDWLLEQLLSMGLVLTEVHEVPVALTSMPSPNTATSEKEEPR
jgi:hypothetical protein